MTDQGARWYVVQTQPRKELLASHHLANQNFEHFCPMRRQHSGRRAGIELRPFFPGYLFAHLDLRRDRWRSVNGTIGVVRLVGSGDGGVPMPVPEGLVESLRDLTDERGELAFREKLVPGDKVRVMGGPFDQLCGTLEAAKPRERVTILLDILSSATRVELARTRLLRA